MSKLGDALDAGVEFFRVAASNVADRVDRELMPHFIGKTAYDFLGSGVHQRALGRRQVNAERETLIRR